MDGFKNVEKVGEIERRLIVKDTKRTQSTYRRQSDSQLILFFCGYRRERAAVYDKLLKLRDTDGFRKQFQ